MPDSVVRLTVRGGSQQVHVTSDTPGIEPTIIGDRDKIVPLDGSVVVGEEPIEVQFRITNYWLLYRTVSERSQRVLAPYSSTKAAPVLGGSALIHGVANFVAVTSSKQKVKFSCRFSL